MVTASIAAKAMKSWTSGIQNETGGLSIGRRVSQRVAGRLTAKTVAEALAKGAEWLLVEEDARDGAFRLIRRGGIENDRMVYCALSGFVS
jgi:hypothetical protein